MSGKKRARLGYEVEDDENEDSDEEMDDGSEDDDDLDDDEDENAINEVMQVDFEGRSPEDIHFDGIQRLLKQLFVKMNVNTSDLTNWIIQHNSVGVVLQQLGASDGDDDDDEDDDDEICVMSITTVVDITEGQKSEFSKQLKEVLVSRCQSSAAKQSKDLEKILKDDSRRVAFLVNERVLGIGAQIEIYQSLWKDMEKEKKREPKFDFSYYVLLSKTLFPIQSSKEKTPPSPNDRVFCNVEDELFHKNSMLSFDFSVSDQKEAQTDDDDDGEAYEVFRTVSVVAADKISQIVSELPAWIQSQN